MSNATQSILHLGASGVVQVGLMQYSSVDALPSVTKAITYTLLVPSERVLSERLVLPGVAPRDAQKAIPFLLEERIAEETAQLQLSIHRVARGVYHVWAMAREWLAQQLEGLAAKGYTVSRVLPDYWLLPYQTGSWTLAVEAELAWVRLDAWHGFSVPIAQLAQVLALAQHEHHAAFGGRCVTFGLPRVERDALMAALGDAWTWQHNVEVLPAAGALHEARVGYGNVLSSSARCQREWQGSPTQLWRWSRVGLCAAGFLALGFSVSEWWCQHVALQRLVPQLQVADARTPEAVWLMLRQRPVVSQTASPWLATLQTIAATLVSQDGVQVLSLDVEAQQWQLTVRAYSLSALTTLKTALTQRGLRVRSMVVQTQLRALRGVFVLEEGVHA